jgi:hypothetical protein
MDLNWQSDSLEIGTHGRAQVKASASEISLTAADGDWFQGLRMEPEHAIALGAALQEAAIYCRAFRSSVP